MSEPTKVKENSDVRKEGKEATGDKGPKRRTAFSKMKGLIATLAVATTFGLATEACSGSDENPPPLPVDGSVVDGGDLDADTDTDADTDSGTDTDSGPDVDSGIVDGGETDSGPDVDGGDTDSGTPLMCSSAADDEVENQVFDKNDPIEIGGYIITYTAPTTNGAIFQITCASDETQTDSQSFGTDSEGTYDAGDKLIKITVHSVNTWHVTASVTVE